MGKFMKPGKVVLVLAGRYSGRKAVIVKVSASRDSASLHAGTRLAAAGRAGLEFKACFWGSSQ
ncbi:ribosomal protein L27, isoform CRA_c [Homo sapiens]|nr:ribosomal protein L27, isoform CRA_c [Homo sapiens]